PLRITIVILAASAAVALLLSVLGLAGVLNDIARQRRRELAIRVALGAQRWRIAYLIFKEGSRLACAGVILGTIGFIALRRLLNDVTSRDTSPRLWMWLAAPLLLEVAVMIASLFPMRRASISNPIASLRDNN